MHANIAVQKPTVYKVNMASNVPIFTDTISQHRWKSAMIDWINELSFTYAITLVWNRTVGLDRARADLRDLMHRVDRRLLGSHFAKIPSRWRTEAMFVFEGVSNDHVHVHSLWRAPRGKAFELAKLFPNARGGIWNDVVESGNYDIDVYNQHGRNDEIIGYLMKQQHRSVDPELVVWASEFHRGD